MKKLKNHLGNEAYNPLESAEEERRLFKRIALGDGKAKDELMKRNTRLVITVAKRYLGQGFSLDDLVGYGFEGLAKACERFDVTRGVSFANYAYMWIRSSITMGITNDRAVHMPWRKSILRSKARREMARFNAENECKMDESDLADMLGVTEAAIHYVLNENLGWSSLDKALHDGDDDNDDYSMGSMLKAGDEYDADRQVIDKDGAERLMAFIEVVLSKREANLFIDYSLCDSRMLPLVADKYGLSMDEMETRIDNCRRRLMKAA